MDAFEKENNVTKPVTDKAAAALSLIEQGKQEKSCFIDWDDFDKDWHAPPKGKGYAVHPKWPGSRPCATMTFAALHKSARESDLTTRNGTRVVVFQKPSLQVRIVEGVPQYFGRREQQILKPFPMNLRPLFIF